MNDKVDSIQKQLHANRNVNILYPAASQSMVIDARFRDALLQTKADPASQREISRLIDVTVRECVHNILRINQYLNISEKHRERLAGIYYRTWDLLQSNDDIDTVLRTEHYPAIQAWVSELYPQTLLKTLAHRQKIQGLACSDYSAELQLNVLALDIENIHGPVLDIGCGVSAALVNYLHSSTVEVYGFDRIVEEETPFIKEANWFDYDYSQRSWGTIISHMAFSNHYRYAIHHDPELQKKMESVFHRILLSLSPEGCLILAPGVQELESAVNNRFYRIEVSPVIDNFTLMKIWHRD